jgi:hypothetical protein
MGDTIAYPDPACHEHGDPVAYALELEGCARGENTIRRLEAERDAAAPILEAAIAELRAEHFRDGQVDGCVMCWPKDGRWPCTSALIADEIAALFPDDQPAEIVRGDVVARLIAEKVAAADDLPAPEEKPYPTCSCGHGWGDHERGFYRCEVAGCSCRAFRRVAVLPAEETDT